MKRLVLLAVICMTFARVEAQQPNPAHQWFSDARFGMFVHFGPYSVLCDGEWVMHTHEYSIADYRKLQTIFNPTLFDAAEWVAAAKSAGMRYITFTTRHHDGFSNWDTKQSDWNIMNTPYGKDLLRQLTDECHRQGIRVGLYYSLADWSRNDYAWETSWSGKMAKRTEKGDWNDYIAFMKAQITELLTEYGQVDIMWFDGEWDQMPSASGYTSHDQSQVDWHYDEIYGLIHELQPNCLVGNNHHLSAQVGEDFQIFEKDLPGENEGGFSANQKVTANTLLETGQTMNWSWGYRFTDNSFKTATQMLHFLVRAAGHGANLLLNVGPKPTGQIEEIAVERLAEMGKWTSTYGETIYGTTAGPVRPQPWGATTQKGKTVYIHVLVPEGEQLAVMLGDKVKSARWLNLPEKLTWKQNRKTGEVVFALPTTPDPIDSIIEVTLK
jgi:alpha-L-fucosidase